MAPTRVGRAARRRASPHGLIPARPRRARHAAPRGGDAPATATTSTRRRTVLEADLGWIVGWKKDDFLGRDVLRAQKADGVDAEARRLRDGRPRHRPPRLRRCSHDGQQVGVVTSGTQTPFLKKAIGMAYVPPALAAPGTEFEIDVRGRRARARGRAAAVLQAREEGLSPSREPGTSNPRTASPMAYPADLKYTKDHEWIRVEGDTGADRHHRLRAAAARRRRLRRAARGGRDADRGRGRSARSNR